MRRSRRPSLQSGVSPVPDYDGTGWTPLSGFARNRIDCWYPAWAVEGRRDVSASPPGVAVTQWNDMGPWGQHLTATYGSSAPELNRTQGVLNGRLAVRFQSTSARVIGDSVKHGAPTGGDKTLVLVCRLTSGDKWLFAKGSSDSTEDWVLGVIEGGQGYYDSGNFSYVEGGSVPNGSNIVLSASNSGNDHVVRVNGVQIASASRSGSVSNSTAPISIGVGRAGGDLVGNSSGCYVSEAICYRASLSTTALLKIERKLGAYYGCAVA